MNAARTFLKEEAPRGPKAAAQKEHPQKQLFQENGLDLELLEPDETLVDSAAYDPGADLLTPVEVAEALVEVAQSAEPGMAVAALLVAHELADISEHATHTLLEKYQRRADTTEEKEICVLGLDEMMAEQDREQAAPELEQLAAQEADPELATQILSLKEPKVEETPTLMAAFYRSSDMCVAHTAETLHRTAPKQKMPVLGLTG